MNSVKRILLASLYAVLFSAVFPFMIGGLTAWLLWSLVIAGVFIQLGITMYELSR